MSTDSRSAELPAAVKKYATYLTTMAGLGGLLYGVDVGIIAAALPYIEQTSSYTPSQLSLVVAAVLLGSVLSSLVAGMLSEWLGRKMMIIISALIFTLSIPVICLSAGNFEGLLLGRLLQGASAGFIGVVVPMYLAECLDAKSRGKGTGMFQFLLTIGLVFAAAIGLVTTSLVGAADDVTIADADKVNAWQTIFWCSALPGVLLFIGAFRLKESPRWLYKRGRKEEALAALAANNGQEAAQEILDEMIENDRKAAAEKEAMKEAAKGDSILQRKYIIPFILAIVILGCNQATGINSVLNYSVKIFQQAGLEGSAANWADFAIKIVNMCMTVVAVSLVDKKGRKFLLKMGTAGIICGLAGVGVMFKALESKRVDVTEFVQGQMKEKAYLKVDTASAVLAAKAEGKDVSELMDGEKVAKGVQLIVTYAQGGNANQVVTEHYERAEHITIVNELIGKVEGSPSYDSDASMAAIEDLQGELAKKKADILADKAEVRDPAKAPLSARLATNFTKFNGTEEEKAKLIAALLVLEKDSDRAIIKPDCFGKPTFLDSLTFWSTPAEAGSSMELVISRAEIGMKPGAFTGWMVTGFFVIFIAFYAAGPGVCVWLALSELMPTRIRANGMAVALLINQGVSTTIAGVFLPWVGAAGYSSVFFTLAGFTVIYFAAAAFFLPETKGRTLEEIEEYFTSGKMPPEKGADKTEQA